MIKSMTAFARAVHTAGTVTAEAVIRSYNSRSLDVACHCPESCQVLEEDIRKCIARTHTRGRIDIRLSVRDEAGDLQTDHLVMDERLETGLASVEDTNRRDPDEARCLATRLRHRCTCRAARRDTR